jgi:hypothetical protein
MWILFIVIVGIVILVILKMLSAHANAANSILKCYSVSLDKILKNINLGDSDAKVRIRETIDGMGLIVGATYIYNIPATTPAREHIRENFEKYFTSCKGVSDKDVSRVIFLIFWYNHSDASFGYDFEKKYKLSDLENYNEFYRLRDEVLKIINS